MGSRVFGIIHRDCDIVTDNEVGVKFTSLRPAAFRFHYPISLEELHQKILERLRMPNKHVAELVYRLPLDVTAGKIFYSCSTIETDVEVELMLEAYNSFPGLKGIELFVVLGDGPLVRDGHFSSAASAAEAGDGQPTEAMPLVPQSSPVVYQSPAHHDAADAGPSRAVSCAPVPHPWPIRHGPPVLAANEEEDSDADPAPEPYEVPMDDDDDVEQQTVPITHGEPSVQLVNPTVGDTVVSYGTMNFDVDSQRHERGYMRMPGDVSGKNALCVGQQFPDKPTAMLALKNYSIERGAEYMVKESDATRYLVRCKEYGKNCNWSVRACQRKGTGLWEIRRYTGDHTCLATTVPQNHRQLDVNVICKNIFRIVEGNPTVTIKDL